MAIKISGSTIIDDSRGIVNAGISTFANDVKYTSATTGLGVFYDRSADTLKLLEDGSDNTKLTLGDNSSYSSYMQIYHDGGNSGIGYINYAGSNKMVLSGNNIALMNTARSENMLTAVENNGVFLYYDNSLKFQTTTNGVTITGRVDPAADSTHDLGTTLVRWRNVYADTLYGDGSNLTGITASNITVADESSDTENFLVFTNSATGNQAPKTGSNLTFNASSGLLYATQFVGDGSSLTNVNAATLTVTANNTANETVYLLFADGNSGSQGAESDTNLTYNPNNNTLTAGAFSGNGSALTNLNASNISSGTINDAYLPATISSDITGTASFINVTANNTNNEQVYLLFADGTSGTQGAETDSLLNYNPSTDVLSAQAFSGSGASLTFLNANNIASGTLAIARGGTNSSATPTAGAIAYGNGSAYLFNSQGTSGQVLVSGGSGAPTWGNTSGLTVGNATNITLADESSDTTCFPIFATSATGNQPPKTDSSALTYNASSGQLSATSFVGDGSQLTGIVAGITPTENIVDQAQPISFFVGTAQTSLAGISTQNFVFNPSSTRLGIGTDSPSDTFEIKADKGNSPTFVNSITQNGGTDLTLTGLQSGDLVLFMGIADSYTVPAPQTDSSYWTAVPGITNNNTSAPYRAIFYKFATGSSITATFTSTNVGYAMLAYRFVDSSTPFDVNVTSNSSSGMPDCPSITPVSDKSLIIAAGFLDDDAVGPTVSAPTGYTLAVASSNTLNPSTLMVAHKVLPVAAPKILVYLLIVLEQVMMLVKITLLH